MTVDIKLSRSAGFVLVSDGDDRALDTIFDKALRRLGLDDTRVAEAFQQSAKGRNLADPGDIRAARRQGRSILGLPAPLNG
jgi:hypothetical protein